MSRSAFRFPRVAGEIERRRSELASEMLFYASSEERSIGAHLFVDAFLDRFLETGRDGDIEAFSQWFTHATSAANPVRPPHAVARAIVPVLQAALTRDELLAESLVPISAIGSVVRAIVAEVDTEPPALDETDAAIGRMMRQLDERDPLTAEHSRAVASWCARIARRLGMNDDDVVHASRSGMVHDIGKLRVPLHLLRAPRTLVGTEWDMMRSHVDFGDQLVLQDELLAPFGPAIRFHHERMSGGGYPYGLKGEEIPFVARIVSVADAFNAMIGRRPYRPPILPSMALLELQRESGRQFDPDAVAALEAVLTRAD